MPPNWLIEYNRKTAWLVLLVVAALIFCIAMFNGAPILAAVPMSLLIGFVVSMLVGFPSLYNACWPKRLS